MKLIVTLLIVTVAYSQAHQRVPSTIPVNPGTLNLGFSANGEKLWEGDMILNEEQVERFTSPLDTRKAIDDERYRWPNGRVPFTISQSSEPDREGIMKGLQHWMDNSCVVFEEVEEYAQEPHLIFRKLSGCTSAVGMQYLTYGQNVSIGENCANVGSVAHEVGHALGFYHEQSRTDRDQYVVLLKHNMLPDMMYAFDIYANSLTYGIPYDYESIMHYPLDLFSANGKNTLVPIDIQKTFLIGLNEKLSFYDLKMANIMYKCNAKCTYLPYCLNDGFVDHNCRCRCPEAFSGNRCENPVQKKGGAHCGGTITSPTTIRTLNYPNKYPKENCIWLIQAPAGKQVRAYFTSFDLLYREKPISCTWDFLEIRTGNPYEGERYCEEELKGKVITAAGNQMALLFRAQYDMNTGFEAHISFV